MGILSSAMVMIYSSSLEPNGSLQVYNMSVLFVLSRPATLFDDIHVMK